jgi:nicotinamidase-related amidase
MMTHLTIDATVRAAYDLGFSCTVIHDACAALQLEFNQAIIPAQEVHYAFLAALQPGYATVLSSDDYLQKTAARLAATA